MRGEALSRWQLFPGVGCLRRLTNEKRPNIPPEFRHGGRARLQQVCQLPH